MWQGLINMEVFVKPEGMDVETPSIWDTIDVDSECMPRSAASVIEDAFTTLQSTLAAKSQELARMREALKELVACEDYDTVASPYTPAGILEIANFRERRAKAWKAARAALSEPMNEHVHTDSTTSIAQCESPTLARMREDARRYQFLKPLYTCIDFEYGDSSEGATPSIVFAIPTGTRWSGNLDASIDAALIPYAKTVWDELEAHPSGEGKPMNEHVNTEFHCSAVPRCETQCASCWWADDHPESAQKGEGSIPQEGE